MDNISHLKSQATIMINLFKAKRFEDLIGKGRVLIRKFPNQIIFYNITSLAYDAIGKKIDAKNLLKKALELEPNNFNVLNNLGLISANSGENKDAEIYYKKALELRPDFLDAQINFGNLKMSQNQNEEAKKLFISALKQNNKIIPAKISLASYYEKSGNFEEAKNLYKEILEENPNHTVADKSISLIHKYKKNDPHLKMMEEKLKFFKLNDKVQLPTFATRQSACFDICAHLIEGEEIQYYQAISTKSVPRRIAFDINSSNTFIQLNNKNSDRQYIKLDFLN